MSKAFIIIAAVICGLTLTEVIALVRLKLSVASNDAYWKQRAEEKGELLYVAIGDSAAQGVGASKPYKSYVGVIADRLAAKTGKSVRVVNLSVSGAKVADALQTQIPKLKKLTPDIVTVEIGANDMQSYDEATFEASFKELVSSLPKGSYVSNMPYFGSRAKQRPNAYSASSRIETIISTSDARLVNLQSLTQARDSWRGYAADYFHPNDRAYQNWADAFWREIIKEL